MAKMFASAALLGLLVCGGAFSAQTDAPVASEESQNLAAFIDAEYGQFTRDYIHVFLGHNACAYSFVDESAFYALADLQLSKMSQRGAELIAEATGPQAQQLSKQDSEYAARFAVLTAMELKSNAITAELAPQYGSGEADCALSAEQNSPRYRALQAYARP